MEWKQTDNKVTIFDKHKSWYKMDIDGEYITKNKEKYTPKKKSFRTSLEKVRRAKRRICAQKTEVLNEVSTKITTYTKPESLRKSHEVIFKLGIHLCFSILMLLTAYCGFSYVLPTQIISFNLSKLEIEGVF